MIERDFGSIQPGLEVCDLDGEIIGKVAHTHRGTTEAPGGDIIEVKSGFLGLGSHYYVPATAIEEITPSAVVLSTRRADFESLGWEMRPAHLSEVS